MRTITECPTSLLECLVTQKIPSVHSVQQQNYIWGHFYNIQNAIKCWSFLQAGGKGWWGKWKNGMSEIKWSWLAGETLDRIFRQSVVCRGRLERLRFGEEYFRSRRQPWADYIMGGIYSTQTGGSEKVPDSSPPPRTECNSRILRILGLKILGLRILGLRILGLRILCMD